MGASALKGTQLPPPPSPQLRTYERFTSLTVEQGGLASGYRDVQAGVCVVAFSRTDIYTI